MSKTEDAYRYYLREIVEKIGLENTPVSFGAEKKCYMFKQFVIFAENILKDADPNKIQQVLLSRLVKQQNIQYLKNCGISVPEIIDIQLKGDNVLEIQERAPGEILFYTNESNVLNLFGDRNSKMQYSSFRDMNEEYRSQFCTNLLERNFGMQKKLKNAPMQHFVKFLSDFKAIEEYGLDLDLHGENFLYCPKKGFSFIDLPNEQSTERKKFSGDILDDSHLIFDRKKIRHIEKYRDVPHGKILYDACKIFADSLKYAGNIYDQELVKKLKKNNTVLVDKLIEASKIAGYKISDIEYERIRKLCEGFCYNAPTLAD